MLGKMLGKNFSPKQINFSCKLTPTILHLFNASITFFSYKGLISVMWWNHWEGRYFYGCTDLTSIFVQHSSSLYRLLMVVGLQILDDLMSLHLQELTQHWPSQLLAAIGTLTRILIQAHTLISPWSGRRRGRPVCPRTWCSQICHWGHWGTKLGWWGPRYQPWTL